MKVVPYTGQSIGKCVVTFKLDGVRAHRVDGAWYSRSGKPLYNLPDIGEDGAIFEVMVGAWEDTVSAVRTKSGPVVDVQHLYRLYPVLDKRIVFCQLDDLDEINTDAALDYALRMGFEGLVYVTPQAYYKHKPVETYDVPVIGVKPGRGKYVGKVGALLTPRGAVGTGLSDAQREEDWVGAVIEVECMSLTPSGKFRHPRLVRRRYDKEQPA